MTPEPAIEPPIESEDGVPITVVRVSQASVDETARAAALEPPTDCPTCHGTRLVYGPCDCIERFGFHEQGRCPGSWKVPCPECADG